MYKSLFVALALVICSATLFAGVTPPQTVLKSFQKKFPSVKQVKWEKENATEYEANFKIDGVECSANFKEDGTWVETETEVAYSTLPEPVKQAFEKQTGKKSTEASKIEKPNNVVVYEVEYKDGMKTKEIVYNADGTLVK